MSMVSELLKDVQLPRMVKVRQLLPRDSISGEEVPGVIHDLLQPEKFSGKIRPGMRICITCGSRGHGEPCPNYPFHCRLLQRTGAEPFVIPAMAAMAAPQRRAAGRFESLGVTEKSVGCPILSSMDTVVVGHSLRGWKCALISMPQRLTELSYLEGSRRILHSMGPMKRYYENDDHRMGKQQGAESCHSTGFKHMAYLVPTFGRIILQNAPILFAVATLENAFDETRRLVALALEEIDAEEPKLLLKQKPRCSESYSLTATFWLWMKWENTSAARGWTQMLPEPLLHPTPAAAFRHKSAAYCP